MNELEAEVAAAAKAKAEAETTVDKFRKAAAHWKKQHDKLKEEAAASAASPAPAKTPE